MNIFIRMGLFTMFFGGIFGCDNTSSLSNRPVTDPGLIRVKIDMHNSTEINGYSYNQIKVTLTDKKNAAVNNNTIIVKVNDEVMRLQVATGNYYDKYPYYQIYSDSITFIEGEATYRFSLVLSDGVEYPVGKIITQKLLTAKQFNFPDSHTSSQELLIKWQEIQESTTLRVIRHTEEIDSTGNLVLVAGSSNDPETMQKEIGPGWFSFFSKKEGEWKIPASYFRINQGKVTDLTFEVISEKEAPVKSIFLKESYIKSVFELKKYIPVNP